MKTFKIGKYILFLDCMFWFGYNIWFGWNKLPISENEKICDSIFSQILGICISLCILIPLTEIFERYLKSKNLY